MKMLRRVIVALALAVSAAGCGASEADQRVLFVGNSYTHGNELPAMVEAIAAANDTSIRWTMIAPGGARLRDHRANPDVVAAIQSGEYDVVVFQEQSQIPSSPELRANEMLPAALALDAIADQAGVSVVWFQTWGHRDGWPVRGHNSYQSMQDAVIAGYAEVGRQTNGRVAGAGARWSRYLAFGGEISLHHADGTHATPAGSYLAALALADALLVGTPLLVAPPVDGVSAEVASELFMS
ncbi:MAG: hypothetical protein AAGC53_21435 [Actinomycetota bacterium]